MKFCAFIQTILTETITCVRISWVMKMLRFSIIIPNYNKEKYIDECLKSIYNQTLDRKKYEIIFIDDGSSDNSLEVASKYDVKILHTNRALAGGARNTGIKVAQGEYLIFLDSDDFLCSNDVLEKLDNHITNQDIIFLNFYRQTENGTVFIETENKSLEYQIENIKTLGCPTKCFRREIVTLFDEKCYYEDVYFTLYALCNSERYSYFSEPFFTYRYVKNSITKTVDISAKKMIDVLLQITKLYYLCDEFPKFKQYLLSRIKRDKLKDRLKILDTYFETGRNTFYDKF